MATIVAVPFSSYRVVGQKERSAPCIKHGLVLIPFFIASLLVGVADGVGGRRCASVAIALANHKCTPKHCLIHFDLHIEETMEQNIMRHVPTSSFCLLSEWVLLVLGHIGDLWRQH
jgi:hypothetical protein